MKNSTENTEAEREKTEVLGKPITQQQKKKEQKIMNEKEKRN